MNGLELGVGHRRLREDRPVVALHEGHQVDNRLLDSRMVGRHELCLVWPERATSDPSCRRAVDLTARLNRTLT
jgi:hypothetical protein